MKTQFKIQFQTIFKPCYFAVLFLTYCAAIYPILRSNFNYIDDMGRVFSGYAGWDGFSRYVSNYLSHVIHAGNYLFDISPIPQLLAVGILCIASLVVISLIKQREDISYWDLATVIPLGLSPYFLECISYKYDSPYMALSILSSVLPLIFYRRNKLIYSLAVIVGTLIMCMTYQAASGIFPMLVLLLAFTMWTSKKNIKDIFTFLAHSAATYLSGLAIFYIFLMRPVDSYVSNGIASISNIIAHYRTYLKLVESDFRVVWLIAILLLTVWFIIVQVYKSKQNKFMSFLIAIVTVCTMALLSFGLYPALEKPLTAPRAMYGVGAYIAFIGVGGIVSGAGRYITRFLTFAMAWLFITFSCAYGNALAVQNEYINFRITEVIGDLTELGEFNTDKQKEFRIVGNAGHAPALRNAIRHSKILARLVPVMFRDNWVWGQRKLVSYYGLEKANIKWDWRSYTGSYEGWKLLHESLYHKIYAKDNEKIVIQLK